MKKSGSDFVIAIGVILCSVVLLGALTWALAGWSPSKPGRVLYIDYPDVTGIRKHSQVRYAGAPAGRVIEMRLLTDEERRAANYAAVRVTLELFDDVPPLPDDVKASLTSDTMLSEKFVALSAGSPDNPKLPDGAILQGTPAASIDNLMESIGPLVEGVDGLVSQMEGTLRGFDTAIEKAGDAVDTLERGLADALPKISRTAETATAALRRVDKLVDEADPLIKEDLRKLGSSLDDLNKTLDSARGLLTNTDKQVTGRMGELSVVLQNLKVATTHAKALTKALGEKPSRLIFSGKAKELPSEQVILRSSKPIPIR